ncbi:STT3 subunit of Oligosaccharyl transferase [Ramicandelaber brevisporus]|nr:STT3 subunit of Oligosaccharyl transferase [Ramicandelaber brevisporus]
MVFNLSAQDEKKLLRVIVLTLVSVSAIGIRLFSVLRYESVIHEFDPWFNYRSTQYIAKHGVSKFWNWFDERSWYPLGRAVGGTVYPGLMVTAAAIRNVLLAVNIPVDIRNVCVFFAPMFSALTALSTYLITKEFKDSTAGLLAAAFMGLAPGYISRSVAGSYDNEGISIFLLMFTFYLWIKAVKQGSAMWAALAAVFYSYMVSAWGGYVFIINLVPLHVFVLLLMGRYSPRLYVAYSTFYVLGTLGSMQTPFVGFLPTKTSEHMAALGTFGLIQLVAFANMVRGLLPARQFQSLLRVAIISFAALAFVALVGLTMAGVVAPWTGRFYSLFDTGYARKHIPIIASVSEHQPTAWPSFFFDLSWLIFLMPAGVYMCFQTLRDEHVFVILYAVFASYFAGVMVRLMLTLTPLVCVAAAIALSHFFDVYLDLRPESPLNKSTAAAATAAVDDKNKSKKPEAVNESAPAVDQEWSFKNLLSPKLAIISAMTYFLVMFVWHCTYISSSAYSSPSVILSSRNPDGSMAIIDDFREAYYWLRKNTPRDAKVLAWWDYGYQLAGMADRITLVDNNTWNNTHIATVGKAFALPEDRAYGVFKQHDVDYVLVIFGGLLGYGGDDLNKFLWMARIAEGVYPDEVRESDFFNHGSYRVDEHASPAMKESVIYKTSFYRYAELFGGRAPQDRARGGPAPTHEIKLHTLEEVFTSEHWMVRLYKVKDVDNLGRQLIDAHHFDQGKKRIKSKSKAQLY